MALKFEPANLTHIPVKENKTMPLMSTKEFGYFSMVHVPYTKLHIVNKPPTDANPVDSYQQPGGAGFKITLERANCQGVTTFV